MQGDFNSRFAAARRRIIEEEFSNLNDMQRQGVLATEGPLLLLAGAGSGKTTVLIHRVANILRFGRASDCEDVPAGAGERELAMLEAAAAGERERDEEVYRLCALDPAPPWTVIAITFTNKATGELRSRLARQLGERAEGIWAMTFHSACARILRRDADRLGFSKSFTIYDQADSLAVMKRVIKELDFDEKIWAPKAMLNAASRCKERCQSPEQYQSEAEKSGDIRSIRTAQICAAYARHLREADAMDFEDLLYFCVKLLEEYEEVREYYQRKFRYVLIDEYQDTNYLQYRLAALLAGERRNICVVGDDDQSIYKFRGATIENILSFEKQYKESRVIRLEQNYRSTGNILSAANAVIAHNTERKGKRLWTEAGAGALITRYIAANEDDEADFVARTIRAGEHPRDFAVLYRTNAQSRALEQALRRYQIDYRVFGGMRFFDRAEVKDMLAYLCVVANPTDETRLLRIVNNPPRGIGAAGLERASEIARREEKPLFEILRTASAYPDLSRGAGRMESFAAMITELQEALTWAELDEFYDMLLEKSGYLRALEEKHGDEELVRMENIRELKSSIVKSVQANEGGDLYAFLDEVALYTDLDSYDENADCAVMMTMHAAKGLEFPTVFIVGAEEGLFPGVLAAEDPAELEEERRLCYVAVTRAREKLYITRAVQRMLYGRTGANPPSRFLGEIPPELLETREAAGLAPHHSVPAYSAARPGNMTTSLRFARLKQRTDLSAPAAAAEFAVGDAVEHRAFGKGVIAKMTPMGGDALVEIEFEGQGTKRLMLRVAAQHMDKIN